LLAPQAYIDAVLLAPGATGSPGLPEPLESPVPTEVWSR